jgi:hypothetical protein
MATEKKIGAILPFHPDSVLKKLEKMNNELEKIKKREKQVLEIYNIDINAHVKDSKCVGTIDTEIPLIHAVVKQSQLFEPLIGSHLEPEKRIRDGGVIPYDIEGNILAMKIAKKYGVKFVEDTPAYELRFSRINQVIPGIKKIAGAKDKFSSLYQKLGACRESYIDALMRE